MTLLASSKWNALHNRSAGHGSTYNWACSGWFPNGPGPARRSGEATRLRHARTAHVPTMRVTKPASNCTLSSRRAVNHSTTVTRRIEQVHEWNSLIAKTLTRRLGKSVKSHIGTHAHVIRIVTNSCCNVGKLMRNVRKCAGFQSAVAQFRFVIIAQLINASRKCSTHTRVLHLPFVRLGN